MIWIIGGTTEGRELARRLNGIDKFIVTIATEGGREFINSDRVLVGRMDKDEMTRFVKANNIKGIVDLSHPYAKVVSENARAVSEKLGIEYLRYVRDKTEFDDDTIYLKSFEECYKYLQGIKGTVFFTTGSKNIGDFEKLKGGNRFIYRVLPAIESLEECKKYNIKMRDIVAILGPFSIGINMAIFSEYKADYVIMKNSGDKGGTLEKLKACKSLGIRAIIIDREKEEGFKDFNTLENIIREKFI